MMLFQRTSIVGTPLQNASSKTSRHIFLGHHYAPHPVPQLSRLTQASRPCLSRQQHNPHWPQIHQGAGRWHRHPPKQISIYLYQPLWLGRKPSLRSRCHPHGKKIPLPLWPNVPSEHIMSNRESCWGYNYRNSMTLCLLRGSNLPPPPGPPRAPEKEGRVFPAVGVSLHLQPGAQRHHFGVISKAGGMEKLLLLALSLVQVCRATLQLDTVVCPCPYEL